MGFGPAAINEEISTWKDVYGMERYKAKLCSETDGTYWVMAARDEWKNSGRRLSDYLKTFVERRTNHPFSDCNFLREPFLQACAKVKAIDFSE